jgi:hypothetical protein
VSERTRERIEWPIKFLCEYKMSEMGRETIKCLVKYSTNSKVSEKRGKFVNWVIDSTIECEMSERGREIID